MSNRPETTECPLRASADGDEVLGWYRAPADAVDGAIFHLDRSGQFVAVDDRLAGTTGYDRDELLGEHVSVVLADGDGERLERATTGLGVDDGVATLDVTIRTAGGADVPSQLRCNAVPGDDGAGGTIGILNETGSTGDESATGGRSLEGTLRESEAAFRQLAEHLEEVVWMTTADMREVLYVNGAFETVWGRDRERLYEDAEILLVSVHPEDRERVRQELDAQVEDEYEVEYRIVERHGGSIRVDSAPGEGATFTFTLPAAGEHDD